MGKKEAWMTSWDRKKLSVMRFWILNNIINTHRLKEAVAYLNGDWKK